jgi:pilus assembly protein CpaF
VLRREIRLVVEHLCDAENTLLNRTERDRIIEEVLDETFGLGPLEYLLKDASISDIMINGPKHVFVERRGRLELTDVEFRDNAHLMQIIDRIVSKVGRRVDETCPMVDARLGRWLPSKRDYSTAGARWSGRFHSSLRFQSTQAGRPAQLQSVDAGNGDVARRLHQSPLNMIICGGTGSGKTTCSTRSAASFLTINGS